MVAGAAVVGDAEVPLSAGQVSSEGGAAAVVVESVEHDNNGIVFPQVAVALGERGGNRFRLGIVAYKGDVKGRVGVADIRDCTQGRRLTVFRLELNESLDRFGQLPDIFVDPAVYYRRLREPGRPDGPCYLALGGSGCHNNQQQGGDKDSHDASSRL